MKHTPEMDNIGPFPFVDFDEVDDKTPTESTTPVRPQKQTKNYLSPMKSNTDDDFSSFTMGKSNTSVSASSKRDEPKARFGRKIPYVKVAEPFAFTESYKEYTAIPHLKPRYQ